MIGPAGSITEVPDGQPSANCDFHKQVYFIHFTLRSRLSIGCEAFIFIFLVLHFCFHVHGSLRKSYASISDCNEHENSNITEVFVLFFICLHRRRHRFENRWRHSWEFTTLLIMMTRGQISRTVVRGICKREWPEHTHGQCYSVTAQNTPIMTVPFLPCWQRLVIRDVPLNQ